MARNWYALRVKPHKERSILQWLEGENIEGYLPLVRVQPKNPRAAKEKPYFPGYLFVHTDLEQQGAGTFNWRPGTIGLIEFGGIPAAVPAKLIADLHKLLAQIEEAGGLANFEYKRGDAVRIVDGPLSGYEAVFDLHLPGKDRVQVLLAILSQSPQPVQLDTAAIKKMKR